MRSGKATRMRPPLQTSAPTTSNIHLLLAYVADLELEVDRLRGQGEFVAQQARETLKRVRQLCAAARKGEDAPALRQIDEAAVGLAAVLRDLQEPPGYHPAHDQFVAVAARPLAEQAFRRQLRLAGSPPVALRLELECEHLEWFPARLRHILDNLIASSLKSRDPDSGDSWVSVGLRESPQAYELRVSDNGVGMPRVGRAQAFELLYRAAPARAAGVEVGLAVVKLLVEQSGGTLVADSNPAGGTSFVAVLPRYAVDDYLA